MYRAHDDHEQPMTDSDREELWKTIRYIPVSKDHSSVFDYGKDSGDLIEVMEQCIVNSDDSNAVHEYYFG